MSTGLTLESNRYQPTRAIVRDGQRIGFLYQPAGPGDGWEVWPSCQTQHPPLDVGGALFATFPAEADALAFLGIQPQHEGSAL